MRADELGFLGPPHRNTDQNLLGSNAADVFTEGFTQLVEVRKEPLGRFRKRVRIRLNHLSTELPLGFIRHASLHLRTDEEEFLLGSRLAAVRVVMIPLAQSWLPGQTSGGVTSSGFTFTPPLGGGFVRDQSPTDNSSFDRSASLFFHFLVFGLRDWGGFADLGARECCSWGRRPARHRPLVSRLGDVDWGGGA